MKLYTISEASRDDSSKFMDLVKGLKSNGQSFLGDNIELLVKGPLRESYEGLEDADEFEDQSTPIEWRSVYWTKIDGVGGEINLLIDVNNPQRWEVTMAGMILFDDNTVDASGRDTLKDLATRLGVEWSHRTSYEDLLSRIKDKVYIKARKDNKWHWPPQWGRLWEPPQGFPPEAPPDWYY